MARPVGSSASTVGINGLKVFRDKLYWTNSGATTIYAMDITPDGFPLSGRVETVVKLDAAFLDDFAVDEKREILWVATNSDNRLFAVDLRSGKAVVAAGGVEQLTLAGDTAAAFGRTERDEGVLYVVTCGGLRQKICGISEGGKVVAVDTKGFRFS
ncbi:putative six-bladed beta-propeller-like protein [Echria macrotheca]|uniref:Six-bladed beta-propeller-like protein n=1 Tax=Echria macrotheca TaxID=438768 RepID=A0AAJ0FGG7_9PEZI|nr:putative six-bladed beta-propeller-like protein [Echria macrotheca]